MKLSLITFGALLSVGVVAGCSSSNSKPTQEEYDDTAQAIGSTTATSNGGSSGGGDVASMSDSVQLALGVTPAGLTLSGSGAGQFNGSKLGLNYAYSLTCTTAGATAPCGVTTDTATAQVDWSGNLTTDAVTASVTRDGKWTLSGLQTSTVSFSGDSTFTFDATLKSIFRPGVTTTYNFDTSAHYDAVKVDKGSHTVVSGTASFDVSAKHMVTGSSNNVDASFSVTADLTFNSDGTASLVLDGTQHYTIHLDTGIVVKVSASV